MDLWRVHKIGIFLLGVVSLALYLYSSARQVVYEAAEAKKRQEETRSVPRKKKIAYYLIFVGVIFGSFVLAIIMDKVLVSFGPDFDRKANKLIFEKLPKLLLFSGKFLSGDETFFFQTPGIIVLEWLLVLSPYILCFFIWTLRAVRREYL